MLGELVGHHLVGCIGEDASRERTHIEDETKFLMLCVQQRVCVGFVR